MENIVLQLNNITKIFPHPEKPVVANDHVSFDLRQGEVHALVGENGTGKSTLMNILYGMFQPDEGEIILAGEKVSFKNPRDAIEHGIGMVHQHFVLVPSFTVAENLVFTYEPRKGIFVDLKSAENIATELSEKYGLYVEPKKKVSECTLSMQQRVEILKILFHGAEILIFDEPTAVLTPQESQELFKAFQALKEAGKSIIFITHKLKEVMNIADRATIMRKGKVIDTVDIAGTSMDELAEKMIGRKIDVTARKMKNAKINKRTSERILGLDHVSTKMNVSGMSLKDITFEVKTGEIIGIAGVGGNGQELLVELITGLLKKITSGKVFYKDKEIQGLSPVEIRKLGIAHITGERYIRGVNSQSDIYDNMIMGFHQKKEYSSRIFLKTKKLRNWADELVEEFDIKTNSISTPIMNLSGGNVQKCILARELHLAERLIIAEEPTRGVDIGSIEFIHNQLVEKAKQGYGIVLISTDLDEVLSLSTRIFVMNSGKIVGEVNPEEEGVEKKIGLYMAGIEKAE